MTRISGRRESVRGVLVSRKLRSSWPQRTAVVSGLSTHRISPPVRFDRLSNETSVEGLTSPPMAMAPTTDRRSASGDTSRSSSNGFPRDLGIRSRTPTTRSPWSGDFGLARTTAPSVESTSRPTSTSSSSATTAGRLAASAHRRPRPLAPRFCLCRLHAGRKGYYASYGAGRLSRSAQGQWSGSLAVDGLTISAECTPIGPVTGGPGSAGHGRRIFPPASSAVTDFVRIAFAGHRGQACETTPIWTFRGSHPLTKALALEGPTFQFGYNLRGGTYPHP